MSIRAQNRALGVARKQGAPRVAQPRSCRTSASSFPAEIPLGAMPTPRSRSHADTRPVARDHAQLAGGQVVGAPAAPQSGDGRVRDRFGAARGRVRGAAGARVGRIPVDGGDLGPTAAQRRYEPESDLASRLGNSQPGDGLRFKGRGPIQLTGRANYDRFGRLLGIDLTGAPERAAEPESAFRVAALYWTNRGLNELADAQNFREITRRINGGFNGLADRERYFERAKAVLATGVAAAAQGRRRGKATAKVRRRSVPPEPLMRGQEVIREFATTKVGSKSTRTSRTSPAKTRRLRPRQSAGRRSREREVVRRRAPHLRRRRAGDNAGAKEATPQSARSASDASHGGGQEVCGEEAHGQAARGGRCVSHGPRPRSSATNFESSSGPISVTFAP